jgi:hypothetical protein
VEHIINLDSETWARLAQRQARLSLERGRHVSIAETLRDLLGEPAQRYPLCECWLESNPTCPEPDHGQPHNVPAIWLVPDARDEASEITICDACRIGDREAEKIENVVVCECSPEVNPGCELGSHEEGHVVPAQWRVSEPDDPDDFFYLCNLCTKAATDRRGVEGYVFEVLEQAGGMA